ncbi:hypothetical protein DSO57_1016700 [Entomophthora muscae]|uniref:Uncharacterized protein n=1 Tax=Entomophthora muscae TaxID=34485 RepID=A0ACC2S6U2_9FUNG|nr:hypothetical protein DSO57_1016700 [Entomophthora muscae]
MFSQSLNALESFIPKGCIAESNRRAKRDREEPKTEVRKIVSSGDPKNRIDVVFMGDGYTKKEKKKFFDDIERLTKDMFEGVTFRSWLPLFNIWAIHVESEESGIGYNGPKNTPFKLFRKQGQLRAIFPGNPRYARQVCKLTGEGGCDYPALIGNDDFCGGTGGEFIIATSSLKFGAKAVRHEMGHNFGEVGEEYDSGQVYSGVNSASSLSNLGWKDWLTGPVREERAMYRILEYPWHDLSEGEWSTTFNSDGSYSRWLLSLSVTAAEKKDSLEFLLDGKSLNWQSKGSVDREFYEWKGTSGFSKGNHTFQVRSLKPTANSKIPQMIASVTLHEFGNEAEFNMDNDNYSAYPTWNSDYEKSYRPTNEKCLMRNMTSLTFCNVCKEGIWSQFLQRIFLIDSLDFKNDTLVLTTLKLGHLREGSLISGERLTIEWTLNDSPATQYNGKLTIPSPAKGRWTANVTFSSPEIHQKSHNWANDYQTIKVE